MNAHDLLAVNLVLMVIGLSGEAALGDTRGEAVFRNRCASCHSLKPGVFSIAPSLNGIVGRKAGTVKDYQYSPALRDASFVWTPHKLMEWLASPHSTVPATEMPFPGLQSEQERASIVQFLEQQHAK